MKRMKYPNDLIENRTRDLPACSAVRQQTVPPPPLLVRLGTHNEDTQVTGKHVDTPHAPAVETEDRESLNIDEAAGN
jgi:hypothetical protein